MLPMSQLDKTQHFTVIIAVAIQISNELRHLSGT